MAALSGESMEMDSTGPDALAETETDHRAEKHHKRDVVAVWEVPTKRKVFKIEFEHGTASGKRVLWIDGKEVFRRDWMFRLVGDDAFNLDDVRCVIRVDPASGFSYQYTFYANSKPLAQYKTELGTLLKVWETEIGEKEYRIVLEKTTLNIYINGQLREETGEFVDGGTDTEFEQDNIRFVLSARTSGNKHDGLCHVLTANGEEVSEVFID